MSFDPKGLYHQYGGQGRKEVFVQNGKLYDVKHRNLSELYEVWKAKNPGIDHKTLIDWMNVNGYAMNAELRTTMVNQIVSSQMEGQMKKVKDEAEARKREMLADVERELSAHRQELEAHLLPPVPPHPSEPTHAPVSLTAVEKKLLGVEDPPDDDMDLSDDESEGGFKLDPPKKAKSITVTGQMRKKRAEAAGR